jgi:hypothetical protein
VRDRRIVYLRRCKLIGGLKVTGKERNGLSPEFLGAVARFRTGAGERPLQPHLVRDKYCLRGRARDHQWSLKKYLSKVFILGKL